MAKSRKKGKTRKKKQPAGEQSNKGEQKGKTITDVGEIDCNPIVPIDSRLVNLDILTSSVQKEPKVVVDDIRDFLNARTSVQISEFEKYEIGKNPSKNGPNEPSCIDAVGSELEAIDTVTKCDSYTCSLLNESGLEKINEFEYEPIVQGLSNEIDEDSCNSEDNTNVHQLLEAFPNSSPGEGTILSGSKISGTNSNQHQKNLQLSSVPVRNLRSAGTDFDQEIQTDEFQPTGRIAGMNDDSTKKTRFSQKSIPFDISKCLMEPKLNEKKTLSNNNTFLQDMQNTTSVGSPKTRVNDHGMGSKRIQGEEIYKSQSPNSLVQTGTKSSDTNNKKGGNTNIDTRLTRSSSKYRNGKLRNSSEVSSIRENDFSPTVLVKHKTSEPKPEALNNMVSKLKNNNLNFAVPVYEQVEITPVEVKHYKHKCETGSETTVKLISNKTCRKFLESYRTKIKQPKTNLHISSNLVLKAKRSLYTMKAKLKRRLHFDLRSPKSKSNLTIRTLRPKQDINRNQNVENPDLKIESDCCGSQGFNQDCGPHLSLAEFGSSCPEREMGKQYFLHELEVPTIEATHIVESTNPIERFHPQVSDILEEAGCSTQLSSKENVAKKICGVNNVVDSKSKRKYKSHIKPEGFKFSPKPIQPVLDYSQGIFQIQTDPPSTELPPPMVYCVTDVLETGIFYLTSQEGNRLQIFRFNGYTLEPFEWSSANEDNVAEGSLFAGPEPELNPESASADGCSTDIINKTEDEPVDELLPAVSLESREASGTGIL